MKSAILCGCLLGLCFGLLLCGRKAQAGGGGKGDGDADPILVGYSYYMAAIFGLCLQATKLLKIVYGEKVAWSGNGSTGTSMYVDAGGLFGGEQTGGSGGLRGTFYFNGGGADQGRDPVVSQYLGEGSPAYRGIVTLSMGSAYVASFSPSFRALRCLVQNVGYDWYPSKATIAGTQINPAHEIREALIKPELSGQFTAADLDEASFIAAADTLYAENFGLSPKWDDSSKAQDYIQSLLTHIDGVLVRDRSTGKLKLKLLRGGYDVAALPVVGQNDFSSLSSLGTVAFSAMQNKITLKYARMTDIGEETGTITGENQANIELQEGRVNATELSFKHVTDAIADLPGRILARELRSRSYPLKSFTLKGLSHLSQFQEGDLFVFSFPEQGIEKLVCRVLEADYGTLDDHQVTLTCTEDIYGVTEAVIAGANTEWENILREPTIPTAYTMQEAPLYIADKRARLTRAQWNNEYPKAGFVLSLASKNAVTDYSYSHRILTQNLWEDAGDGSFASFAALTQAIGQQESLLPVLGDTNTLPLRIGDLGFIDAEIVEIRGWSSTSLTVNRGMLDTVPQAHALGARLWLPSTTGGGMCKSLYQEADTARITLATRNSLGMASVTAADLIATPMRARAFRPYPPAGLAFNGTYLAQEIEGALTLSWKHRDRWEQIDTLVTQSEANVGPEEGTTYNLKVYDENNVLKKNLTGLTGTSWTWDTETSDCEFPALELVWTSTDTTNTAAASFSVSLSTAVQAGDMLIAHVLHRDSITPPVGWAVLMTSGAGGLNQALSVLYKTATTADSGTISTWAQASSVRINVMISAWRHESGCSIDVHAIQFDEDTDYSSMALPSITSTKNGVVVFAVCNAYAFASGTTYSTTVGSFFTPSSGNDLRLVVGSASATTSIPLNGTISNNMPNNNVANAFAASALVLYPADGSSPRQYNRSIRVELEAMRDGYASWQKWNHTVTRQNVEPEAPVNFLLAHMSAGTATGNGITASIDAEGVLTLNGTASAVSNIKYTGGLDINAGRPSAWDSDSVLYEGTTALTLAVTVVGGTYSLPEGVTDSLNITTRYSTASIFLNAKLGDGITSINGTPASPVKMGVIYLRAGVALENLQLRLTLHEGL